MVVTVWPTTNVSLERCASRASPPRILGHRRRLLLTVGAQPPSMICLPADEATLVCLIAVLHFLHVSLQVVVKHLSSAIRAIVPELQRLILRSQVFRFLKSNVGLTRRKIENI